MGSRAGFVVDTSWCDAIQVLAADRDTNNQVSEGTAILLDSSFESGNLIIDHLLTGRCPHSEQKCGLGVDGGLDGLDDTILGTMLDHGIQAGARPAIGAWKLLCGVEFVFKIDQLLRLIVVELSAVVEPLDRSIGC